MSLAFSSRTDAFICNAIHLGGYLLAWTTPSELPTSIGMGTKLHGYCGMVDHFEYEIARERWRTRQYNFQYMRRANNPVNLALWTTQSCLRGQIGKLPRALDGALCGFARTERNRRSAPLPRLSPRIDPGVFSGFRAATAVNVRGVGGDERFGDDDFPLATGRPFSADRDDSYLRARRDHRFPFSRCRPRRSRPPDRNRGVDCGDDAGWDRAMDARGIEVRVASLSTPHVIGPLLNSYLVGFD